MVIFLLFFSLLFTAYITNGGYVSVYNREASNRIERYEVKGRTKTNVFEVGFDNQSPQHCVMNEPACTSQPLMVPDATDEVSVFFCKCSCMPNEHFLCQHKLPAKENTVNRLVSSHVHSRQVD